LQGKPQTIDEIKAYRQEARVESTAPTAEIDALKQEVKELREHVRVLTAPQPVSDKQQSRSAPPPSSDRQSKSRSYPPPPPRPEELPQREAPLPHGSFSEEAEYPHLPTDLNELQAAKCSDLDELLQDSTSPANGQPIIIVESETPDYAESQGMEQ
jgi:hypothetical protein